jgi:hypothetical protein
MAEYEYDDDHLEDAALVDEMENIPNETANERFLRLVNKRLPVAVKRIRLIKNLAGPSYEYTEAQANILINTLQAEIEHLAQAFRKEDDDDVPVIK